MNMQNASAPAIPIDIDSTAGRLIVGDAAGGKAHILHCNYYNTYLQRTLWKDAASFIDAAPILVGAAAEQARSQLTHLYDKLGLSGVEQRKDFAARFYSWQGFGHIDLSQLTSAGGTVRSKAQHYAEGWKTQFGRADEPVGLMTMGWLAGMADAVFDLVPGTLKPTQTECAAVTGGQDSVFVLGVDGQDYPVYQSSGIGPVTRSDALPAAPNSIDAEAVAKAVMTLPLFGDRAVNNGLINAFDVLISWHPHGYYDRISFECLHKAIDQFGDEGRGLMEALLEEAGHRCAFRTFGGIWRSAEWAAVVEPMCRTPEDWIHGMVAIVNCAGWGRVSCTRLSRDEAVFNVQDDYESIGYLHMFGQAPFAPIYLLRGGFRGMMNLVYNGGILSKPALTEAFYESLHRHENAYGVEVLSCRAQGDANTMLRVFRKG